MSVIERSLRERREELIAVIDKLYQDQLAVLDSAKKTKLKAIEIKVEELELQVMVVESFRSYTGNLSGKGSACDVARSAKDLLSQV